MEDNVEDVAIINSSLPENSVEVTSTEAEPLTQNNLYVAESVEVFSTEDSIICIDEDETSEELPPNNDTPLNLSTTSLPITIPSASDDPESSSVSHSNDDDDDDFCIVFEKKASPSEVQILENYTSPNTHAKKTHRKSQNPRPSNQCEYHNSSATEQTNPSLDDSISIVEDNTYVHVAPSENQNVLNRLQQLAAESTEKKKRKIECSICFEGPDEIEASGKTLVSTVCGHIFCSDCITIAIKSFKHCPQCRKKLTMKQFHVLYV